MSTFNELLAAAKKYRSEYCRDGDPCRATGHELETAIAAAEREAAELAEPISPAFLIGMDWVFSRADNQWKHPTERLWFSMETGKLCVDCYASITMESKGQLLSLLKGLGIEVAK